MQCVARGAAGRVEGSLSVEYVARGPWTREVGEPLIKP
jgi:hypothetical protein